MNYTTHQYAKSLYEALKESSDDQRSAIVKRFYERLVRDRKLKMADLILKDVEGIYAKEEGLRKVIVESPEGVSAEVRKSISEALGDRIVLKEKKNPSLLGGISILIDDEILIDASAKKHLSMLFNKSKTNKIK